MLICLDLHAKGFMPYFPMFYASLSSRLMIRVICSHICMMLLATLCTNLCVYALFAMSHAQIYIRTCLYAWIHILPCLCAKFLHVYMYVSMPICLDLCSHMSMCLDLCSLHALCYIPCICALHAMFVCLDLGYVCHAMCYYNPFVNLSFFIVFWPNGWDPIQTLWFLSSSVHLSPHQRLWITPICMFMLAHVYALCLCQPLQFKALPRLTPLAGLWLCGYI